MCLKNILWNITPLIKKIKIHTQKYNLTILATRCNENIVPASHFWSYFQVLLFNQHVLETWQCIFPLFLKTNCGMFWLKLINQCFINLAMLTKILEHSSFLMFLKTLRTDYKPDIKGSGSSKQRHSSEIWPLTLIISLVMRWHKTMTVFSLTWVQLSPNLWKRGLIYYL